MPIINGITFAEDHVNPSPTHRWAPENCAKTRRLYLPYDSDPNSLDLAALALLGYASIDSESVGGVRRAWVKRVLPDAYPATPTGENLLGEDFLYANSIPSCEPTARPEGIDEFGRSKHSWNRFTVNYEGRADNLFIDDDVLATGDYDATLFVSPLAQSLLHGAPARPDEGDALRRGWINSRFVIKQVDPAARTISLPQGVVKWQALEGRGPNEALNEGLPYTEARALVTYHWLCVPIPAIPYLAIQKAMNRVNQLAFDGWPVGTLLMKDPKIRKYRTATGQRVADLAYAFLYRPSYDTVAAEYRGWNSSLRCVDGKLRWWKISADSGAINPNAESDNKIFQHFDFANLFRADWPYPF